MPTTPLVIEGYGAGRFRISGTTHRGSVIVLPQRVIAWSVAEFAHIDATSLPPSLFAEEGIELLLLGCGVSMQPVPTDLRAALREAGAVVEPMDTGAAARTYNVLLAEGRRVAAALVAIE